MTKIKNIKFMSNERYENIETTQNNQLYAVDWYDFTVKLENPATAKIYTLDFPKKINPKNYFVNAYFYVHTAVHNFSVGDVIPFNQAWGDAYRNLGFSFNEKQLTFPTSNQISVINKNTVGTTVGLQGAYTTVCFDFYKLK